MHQELSYVYVARHHVLVKLGRTEDALLAARDAVAHRRRTIGANHSTTLDMQRLIVQNLVDSGLMVEAKAEFLSLVERVPRLEGSAFVREMREDCLELGLILAMVEDKQFQEAIAIFDRALESR